MKMSHPTDDWRTKNVPDDLVDKYIEGGWTESLDVEVETELEPEVEAPESDPLVPVDDIDT